MQNLVSELYQERHCLVARLNAIHHKIQCEDGLARKVLLKIEWLTEKRESIKRLTGMITKIRKMLTIYGDDFDDGRLVHETVPISETEEELRIEQLKTELYELTLSMISGGSVLVTSIPKVTFEKSTFQTLT